VTEADRLRLEVAKIRRHQQPLSLMDPEDIDWLLALVEAQDLEIEGLKESSG